LQRPLRDDDCVIVATQQPKKTAQENHKSTPAPSITTRGVADKIIVPPGPTPSQLASAQSMMVKMVIPQQPPIPFWCSDQWGTMKTPVG
jgi:hypothetical protein